MNLADALGDDVDLGGSPGGGAWGGGTKSGGGGAWPSGAQSGGGGPWPGAPQSGGGGPWPGAPQSGGGGLWPGGAQSGGGGSWHGGQSGGGSPWPGGQSGGGGSGAKGQSGGGGDWIGGGGNKGGQSGGGGPSPGDQSGGGGNWFGGGGNKGGQSDGRWFGGGSNPSPGSSSQRSLTVPYRLNLPRGCHDNIVITIAGVIKNNPIKFTVDMCSTSDIPFHFNPRFNDNGQKVIVMNNCCGKKWGREERVFDFPFVPGKQFEMKMYCTREGFRVKVDGRDIGMFKHRVRDLSCIKQINIYNDLTLIKVEYQ